ncbi:MAG: phosphodiesterase [Clostridiales bacterium]|nr:phosphodiesterase [Clostridiales bacterium]
MKILFASDIHGSASACEKVLEQLTNEKADRLVLLGDLLYHGPRNDLPDQYSPKAVLAMLNECEITPLCVRGNCDAEVDQMVLDFPIMADYTLLPLEDNRCAFVTHGHLFNTQTPPPYQAGDVLIHGHTHVHCVIPQEDYTYINPGSAALPKEGQVKSYMIYEGGVFVIKDLMEGKELMRFDMNS